MSARHVDVENHVTLVLPLPYVIIRHADWQGPLFAVVHRRVTKEEKVFHEFF